MYEKIKERYMKYYVTDAQLGRYVTLGVISEAQAEEIRASRNMEEISSGGGATYRVTLDVPAGARVVGVRVV